jgi:hypothetical protein
MGTATLFVCRFQLSLYIPLIQNQVSFCDSHCAARIIGQGSDGEYFTTIMMANSDIWKFIAGEILRGQDTGIRQTILSPVQSIHYPRNSYIVLEAFRL